MERVSSNLTLFYKVFVPVFWIVFFGSFSAAVLLSPEDSKGEVLDWKMGLGIGFFFISGVVLLYFTLMQLKRVEMGEGFIYVTNYFQNYRYPYHNVERIEISTFLFVSVASVYLKVPGRFGKKILFAPAMGRLKERLPQDSAFPVIWNAGE
ncbi:MAG: hypothetical protein ACKOAY_02190 [Haliscomenobacter sp.]